jgi:hypothetical protein
MSDSPFTPREPNDESMTTTLTIPFAKEMFKPETGTETIIAMLPDELVSPRPQTPAANPEVSLELLRMTAEASQMMNLGVRIAGWYKTRDPAVVEQRGEGDRCPTCRAGVDQALSFMRDDPNATAAVGILSWCSRG